MAGSTKLFKEAQGVLRDNGYNCSRINGSHYVYMKNGMAPISINIRLNEMVWKRLVKANDLFVD